jgi:small subunit ribosomal protein S7
MPRKKTVILQVDPAPDRKYNSVIVQKLINKSMVDGKKSSAEKAVYMAMDFAATKLKSKNPLEVLETALENVFPAFEVKGRRVGGANFQIPFPVQGHRRAHLGLMWFVAAARGRKGMPYWKRLGSEIADAHENSGGAVKKKEDVHKMAEANRAFAHFARTR